MLQKDVQGSESLESIDQEDLQEILVCLCVTLLHAYEAEQARTYTGHHLSINLRNAQAVSSMSSAPSIQDTTSWCSICFTLTLASFTR